jgi:hypothetical protein
MSMLSNKRMTIPFLLIAACWVGCEGGGSGDTTSATDAGSDGSSEGSDGDAGSDADGDADSDVDPGEEEMPTDLPGLCRADIVQSSASETDDYVGTDKGDGRIPDIAADASGLMAWSYYSADAGARWEIQVAPFDFDEGARPGPEGGPPGPTVNPATRGPVALDPALAARGSRFGLVWRDGRYDASCSPDDYNACVFDMAFLEVDAAGAPVVAAGTPSRLTQEAAVWVRPAITATASGYVVAWVQPDTFGSSVMTRAVAADGQLGNAYTVSAMGDVEREVPPALAAIGDKVVVVWGLLNQSKIEARVLDGSGKPEAEVITVADGVQCVRPQIVAGAGEFLVSWAELRGRDLELFTRRIDPDGALLGTSRRITWTPDDVAAKESALAWDGTHYGMVWLSSHENGESECKVPACKHQVFGALLDGDGALASEPASLSKDEPNSASEVSLAWDGNGFTAIWELPRGVTVDTFRRQAFYGRMQCLDPEK